MSTKKIKLRDVNALNEELSNLLGEKISFSSKYEIKNIVESLKTPSKNLTETISEIYKKYGEESEDKEGSYKILDDNLETANKELSDLLDKEVEIESSLKMADFDTVTSEYRYFNIFSILEK